MSIPASPATAAPETILCDTSFVSIVQSSGRLSGWGTSLLARLDAAILAISVVTLAEIRDGHIYARWGDRRREAAERLIASYLWVPLDMTIIDECARLRALCRRSGTTVPDNDIWISAGRGGCCGTQPCRGEAEVGPPRPRAAGSLLRA